MDNKIKRAIISVIVLVAIYLGTSIFIRGNYDMYLEAMKVLAAVIGAGCYWIGSKE